MSDNGRFDVIIIGSGAGGGTLARHLAPSAIVADDAVSPGGCCVKTKFGVIDQQIESQLRRIEEELG